MDYSLLTEEQLQNLFNMGNFKAGGELASRKFSLNNKFQSSMNEKLGSPYYNYSNDVTEPDLEEEYANLDPEIDPYSRTEGILDAFKNFGGNVGGYLKDGASRMATSNVLGKVGSMINPILGMAGGITGLLRGGNMFDPSQSQINFNNLSPQNQAYTSSLYNPGGLLSGYNQISAFGQGALGTLQNRLGNIQNRSMPQSAYSIALANQIQNSIDNIITEKDRTAGMNAPNNIGLAGDGGDSGGNNDAGYSSGQDAGMGFGGGRSDPTDKS